MHDIELISRHIFIKHARLNIADWLACNLIQDVNAVIQQVAPYIAQEAATI